MPPRTRVTEESIIRAALEVVRKQGYEHVNVRSVSERLRCSTQPVMYHFTSVEKLKKAIYREADKLHTSYILNTAKDENPVLGIGLNYIRFAVEEPQLFRFLFQSGYAEGSSLLEMVEARELLPVLEVMREGTAMSMEKTKQVFITIAMFAHGYASLLANNHLEFDEKQIAEHLRRTWNGAVLAAERGE